MLQAGEVAPGLVGKINEEIPPEQKWITMIFHWHIKVKKNTFMKKHTNPA